VDTRFEGKAAIITGASRGIGLAIAQRIVDEGGRVCITARKQETLDEAVAALGADRAIAVSGKGDDAEHQESAVKATLEAFGRIDCLVNNAGINPVYGRLVDLDLGAARKIVEVNCLAALAWTQRTYHGWMAEHGGSIVNVASVAGLGSSPGIGFYGASKAMLINMTRQLAVELGPTVRVNAVAPAVVKTDFAKALYSEGEEKVAQAYPLKRLGVPADIGSAVAFLLSEDASWMTGELVVLDGGVTLTRER
jgi:NAD(P)-dependent dehydrogenase (short-subunit alcohol dehydrogenase family)